MNYFFTIPLITLISFLLTELIRRYTLKKNFIDIPNDRSSHTIPTPRGGGLSIVITFLISIGFVDTLSQDIYFAIIGSGLIVAITGFWDDLDHIHARWRLLTHFAASFWIIYWLGNLDLIQLFSVSYELGWIGSVIVVFCLVWLLNLFNFMDGIDGIAASEAVFIAGCGAYFSHINGLESLSFISLILAASTMGFLMLNWSPAKIFMGDVGSGFLGLILGIIAYANILEGSSTWIWLMLFSVFLVDSGITLIRRILNGDKFYEAHCSHAYQHAARKWGHKKVTISVILINLVWLFPLSYLSHLKPELGFWITFLAYTPLIIVALKLKAGINENHAK